MAWSSLAGTIAANVRIGRADATARDIQHALAEAGLTTWLQALPDGIHTVFGEDGVVISGEQRQRVGLVSAAEILILDEPTAMLDPTLAHALLDDVLATDRTLIVVTHDPAGPERFDRVVELRDGSGYVRTQCAVSSSGLSS